MELLVLMIFLADSTRRLFTSI